MFSERVLTAAVIIPLVFGAIYLGGSALLILSLLIFLAINVEYFSMATNLSLPRVCFLILSASLIPLGFLAKGYEGMVIATAVATMSSFVMLIMLIESDVHEVLFDELVPAVMLGICYTGFLGAMFPISALSFSNKAILWLVCCTATADTFSYLGGRMFSNYSTRLSVRLSPNKTVVGTLCGLLFTIAVSVLVGKCWLSLSPSVPHLAILGFVVGLLAAVGDLSESLVKRVYQAKDSGSLLPGHGGVLDRVDSLLFCLPVLVLANF